MSEFLTLEDGVEDAWVCPCGNTACSDGFYPAVAVGDTFETVTPDVDGTWKGVLYQCGRCARVVNQDTLEVVARTSTFVEVG